MPRSGRCKRGESSRPKNLWPTIWLLVFVGCAYFGFHAIRADLPPGFIRTALPSLLTPLAMFGVVELLPSVRFDTRRLKWLIFGATTLVAAVWLEAVVPRLTDLASGAWQDVLAMGIGFALFCGFDWLWGNTGRNW